MSGAFRKMLGVQVRSCDLSEEACARAREIFQVEADRVDGVALPYADNSFDVVLSSESLEHIPQYEGVLKELLRVAKKAVVITVPHDGPEAVADNIRCQAPHGHIHDFTLASFKPLVSPSYGFKAWGSFSQVLRLPYRLIDGRPITLESRTGPKRWLVQMLNPFILLGGKLLGKTAFKFLLKLDPFLSNSFKTYRQLVFIIAKDPACLAKGKVPEIDLDGVLDFKVPLYRLPPQPVVALKS